MRQHTNFSLQWIHGVPYLLPFGQAVADHRRGLRINGTGAFIWNFLQTERSREELLDAVLSHYEIPQDEQGGIIRDTDDFLATLASYGMLVAQDAFDRTQDAFDRTQDAALSDTSAISGGSVSGGSASKDSVLGDSVSAGSVSAGSVSGTSFPDFRNREDCASSGLHLMIGGLSLRLLGPAEFFPREFLPFEACSAYDSDCTIFLHTTSAALPEDGTLLLENRELFVYESSLGYRFLFPASAQISAGYVTKNGEEAHFFLCPPASDAQKQELFHAIRLVFLYLGQLRGLFAIHSASLLYRGKAWLFSGHSGMGKSTHTNLWNRLCGTPLLNGDLNLMELTADSAVIHGIPWCGTSEISTTASYPLGGIVLLGRAECDYVETLSDDEKALLVMQRLISPCWREEQLAANLAFTGELTSRIAVCRLKCTKSAAAVDVMRQWIDAHLL